MELSVDKRPDVAVITIIGSVDSADSDALLDFLNQLIDAGQIRLVVDLAGMDFIASMGLGALVRTYTRLSRAGGFLRLAQPQPPILKLIKTTALDRLLPIYDALEQALK